MRVQKVRVLVDPALVPVFGLPELLAYVPLEGNAADLRRHLEDAWPGARDVLRAARIEIDGEPLTPGAALPPRTVVALRPGA